MQRRALLHHIRSPSHRIHPPVAFHDPVWSPDGMAIAFYSNADGDFDLYVYSLVDRSIRQLTNAEGTDGTPLSCWLARAMSTSCFF